MARATSESAEPSDGLDQLGSRLKGLRAARGWTLEELSERTGLSRPFLSRLEAGDRQPSIAAVLTLARAYGVPVGAMFEESESDDACVVVRGGDAPQRRADGLRYVALSSTARFANLQPMRLTVSATRGGDERYQHEGEEWVYVLSGRLRLALGDKAHDLDAGDAAHFDSRVPHRLIALDGADAELIVVACPLPERGMPETTPRVRKHRAVK